MDIPVKPRVLIADDSRIVRAMLIKHIEGMFDFREALNGEDAWEALLLDPTIRIVITDLTMPKLDGYGLLNRIRGSRIARIRELPVVVVSGSDEHEERERAKAAGATDLITKGIGTSQLLSRLRILSELVNTQRSFERSLEALARAGAAIPSTSMATAESMQSHARPLLVNAVKEGRNFVLLVLRIGMKHAGLGGVTAPPPASVVDAVGQLLQRTVRQSDHVAKIGEMEFAVATCSINFDSARRFAQRVSRAVVKANMVDDDRMSFVASCGLASLTDASVDVASVTLDLMLEHARRRSLLASNHGSTCIIGEDDEIAYERDGSIALAPEISTDDDDVFETTRTPDIAMLLGWIKEGRQNEVLPHIGKISTELQPLVDLMLNHARR
jgi:two-component system cell cycle response regulator